MTRKQLIAEALTSLKTYDESGLVDYKSVNRWIKNELKRFGANVMELTEETFIVENGEVKLPEGFYSLHLAAKCDPDAHQFFDGGSESLSQHSFWRDIIDTTQECAITPPSHCITSDLQFNNCQVKIYYNNPVMLRLVRGIKKEFCSSTCRNFKVSSPYEVNISQERLQLNFRNGFVYTQFYALPTDEKGELLIPDNRSLQEYLIAYVTRRILQDIFYNDDDASVGSKLQYATAQEEKLFPLAQTSVKFGNLYNWDKKIQQKNRRDVLRFENLFPSN